MADRHALAAQAEADAWNDKHASGVPVILTDDFGRKHRTWTRSKAWEICGHASVLVEGRSGGYLLSRIEFDAERAAERQP